MVSFLIFKFLSHSEGGVCVCVCVFGVRMCSNSIDLLATVHLSQHHLPKRLSFFSFYAAEHVGQIRKLLHFFLLRTFTKDFTQKMLGLINKLSKVAGHKINIHKDIGFGQRSGLDRNQGSVGEIK